jgi:hypothetical protein
VEAQQKTMAIAVAPFHRRKRGFRMVAKEYPKTSAGYAQTQKARHVGAPFVHPKITT